MFNFILQDCILFEHSTHSNLKGKSKVSISSHPMSALSFQPYSLKKASYTLLHLHVWIKSRSNMKWQNRSFFFNDDAKCYMLHIYVSYNHSSLNMCKSFVARSCQLFKHFWNVAVFFAVVYGAISEQALKSTMPSSSNISPYLGPNLNSLFLYRGFSHTKT